MFYYQHLYYSVTIQEVKIYEWIRAEAVITTASACREGCSVGACMGGRAAALHNNTVQRQRCGPASTGSRRV